MIYFLFLLLSASLSSAVPSTASATPSASTASSAPATTARVILFLAALCLLTGAGSVVRFLIEISSEELLLLFLEALLASVSEELKLVGQFFDLWLKGFLGEGGRDLEEAEEVEERDVY